MKKLWIVVLLCGCLFLNACSARFAGDWTGSGSDDEGNEYTFAAKVVDLGNQEYRVLVLESLDSQDEPLHVMDGVLKKNKYTYTADEETYTGGGTLSSDTFTGYYKGPVDGKFKMQRVKE